MITRNQLNDLVVELATITNQATSEAEAISKGLPKYLYLEYASAYGGYRLINVSVNTGTHSGAFDGSGCESRLKAFEMDIKLRGILTGINYAKHI